MAVALSIHQSMHVSIYASIHQRENYLTKQTSFDSNQINTLALLDLMGTYRDG